MVVFSSHLLSTFFLHSDRIFDISFYLSINIFYKLILSDAIERTNTSFEGSMVPYSTNWGREGVEKLGESILFEIVGGKITKED